MAELLYFYIQLCTPGKSCVSAESLLLWGSLCVETLYVRVLSVYSRFVKSFLAARDSTLMTHFLHNPWLCRSMFSLDRGHSGKLVSFWRLHPSSLKVTSTFILLLCSCSSIWFVVLLSSALWMCVCILDVHTFFLEWCFSFTLIPIRSSCDYKHVSMSRFSSSLFGRARHLTCSMDLVLRRLTWLSSAACRRNITYFTLGGIKKVFPPPCFVVLTVWDCTVVPLGGKTCGHRAAEARVLLPKQTKELRF